MWHAKGIAIAIEGNDVIAERAKPHITPSALLMMSILDTSSCFPHITHVHQGLVLVSVRQKRASRDCVDIHAIQEHRAARLPEGYQPVPAPDTERQAATSHACMGGVLANVKEG